MLFGIAADIPAAPLIDTGDYVKHRPTGEEWIVAYVRGDRLAWCGWPEGEALLADCELVEKASPARREKWLRRMRESGVGPRRSHAEQFHQDYEVTCARCAVTLMASEAVIEEGDEWECAPCNKRENRRELAEASANHPESVR